MKQPVHLAFISPKGGVGKTALTTIVASYLHYNRGYKVAVADCTYSDYSLECLRNSEVERITEDKFFRDKAERLYRKSSLRAYPIITATPHEAYEKCEEFTKTCSVDFIIYDTPNVLTSFGVISLMLKMDVVIFPVTGNVIGIDSLHRLITAINERAITTGQSRIREMWLLRNMTNHLEGKVFDEYCRQLSELTGVSFIGEIPLTKHIRRDIFNDNETGICTSTLFPPDDTVRYRAALTEILGKIEKILKRQWEK